MNRDELDQLLREAILNKQRKIERIITAPTDPNATELRRKLQHEREAFQAVLSYLNGDAALLKIHADME